MSGGGGRHGPGPPGCLSFSGPPRGIWEPEVVASPSLRSEGLWFCGSLALSVYRRLSRSQWVSVSTSLRQSAGLRHPRVCISPLTSLCEFLSFSSQVAVPHYGSLCVSPPASLCMGLGLRDLSQWISLSVCPWSLRVFIPFLRSLPPHPM